MATIEEDLLARIDTANLYQPFLEKVNTLLNNLAARGLRYVATCGTRTYDQQAVEYAKGRTTGELGHIVTKAKPGQSPHNFRVAIDFCLDGDNVKPGLQPDYEDAHYKALAEEAEKLGLEAGFYWEFQDTPHVQLPVRARGLKWRDLDKAYRQGGYQAVDRLLDAYGPW